MVCIAMQQHTYSTVCVATSNVCTVSCRYGMVCIAMQQHTYSTVCVATSNVRTVSCRYGNVHTYTLYRTKHGRKEPLHIHFKMKFQELTTKNRDLWLLVLIETRTPKVNSNIV